MKIFNLEMEWIHEIQNTLRTPLLDWFFIGWNYLDTFAFSMIVIIGVRTLIERKIGIKMLYILILSGVLNKVLKAGFGLPRPCHLDPSVTVWVCYPNFGFPSGAAQSAMIYLGVLLIETKKRINWLWGALFGLLLCFSRIYLGLHFFTDILGGIVVGAFLVLLYWKLFPLLEPYWKWAALLFPFLLLPLVSKPTFIFFWISLGVGLGLLLPPKSINNKWIDFSIVLVGCVLCLFGLTLFPKLSPFFSILMGFWLTFSKTIAGKPS